VLARRSRGLLSAILIAMAGAALVSAPGQTQPPPATATARAFEREDLDGTVGLLEAGGTARREGATTAVTTSIEDGTGAAQATARAVDVTLFDGLATAESVEVAATATASGTRASGRVRRLRIDGRLVGSPHTKHVYRLGPYGTLAVLSEGRTGVVGLRATLNEPYGGYPAGATVSVAYASARATDGAAPAAVREREPRRSREDDDGVGCSNARSDPGCGDARERAAARRARRARRAATPDPEPAPPRRPAPELEALRTSRGYAFPVYRGYSYSDDWGAPRQYTGRHEGTDIFAPSGTPVLAVTDGTLFRVGTRAIPGNRLWLRGERGDTFFYAHLSAFAEGARNGARVEAGDVVGFVGSTGDAEETPPHLHFEVHPEGGDPVNPHPFVRAWEERRDVPAAAWLTRYGADPGARPGVLVVVEDFLEP
jgi:murein DD-endopeptidase MepM/ murein hydrolase activator NlpD